MWWLVAARCALRLASFLLAIARSWLAVLLTVLVLDLVILVVPWHSLKPDSVKRVDLPLPLTFVTEREVSSETLQSSFLAG
jgi:hypothetical protein